MGLIFAAAAFLLALLVLLHVTAFTSTIWAVTTMLLALAVALGVGSVSWPLFHRRG